MGLDISVYKIKNKLNKEDFEDEDDMYEVDGAMNLYNSGNFGFDQSDTYDEGFYETDYLMGFRAGSYGGYGQFRKWLANFVGFDLQENEDWDLMFAEHNSRIADNKPGVPFIEMIYFSDCEGYIGPKTSEKLYNDFDRMERKLNLASIDAEDEESFEYYKTKYHEWKEAFELAANNKGVVVYH